MFGIRYYSSGYVIRHYLFASWHDALSFCEDANKLKGTGYQSGMIPFSLKEMEKQTLIETYNAKGHGCPLEEIKVLLENYK